MRLYRDRPFEPHRCLRTEKPWRQLWTRTVSHPAARGTRRRRRVPKPGEAIPPHSGPPRTSKVTLSSNRISTDVSGWVRASGSGEAEPGDYSPSQKAPEAEARRGEVACEDRGEMERPGHRGWPGTPAAGGRRSLPRGLGERGPADTPMSHPGLQNLERARLCCSEPRCVGHKPGGSSAPGKRAGPAGEEGRRLRHTQPSQREHRTTSQQLCVEGSRGPQSSLRPVAGVSPAMPTPLTPGHCFPYRPSKRPRCHTFGGKWEPRLPRGREYMQPPVWCGGGGSTPRA